MSAMDALLERSRSPGTFVERRRFSLARDKAIEKMKEFSLRDPQQYVLEFIQGAVFAGATYVAVDTRRERLLVGWVGGRPYTKAELEHLFDYLFASQSKREHRHVVQLAIGLNALLQRRPRSLRVESGDGTSGGTVRLDLDPSGKGTLGVPESGLAGTYILAEFEGGWFDRFKGRTITPEQELVETRCRYTPVPILLNGTAPFGYRSTRTLMASARDVRFDDGHRRGVFGLSNGKRGIRLVVGGVIISEQQIPELASVPLHGVICDDSLRKTADQSDIVQDEAFRRMLHAVQPHATKLVRQERDAAYQPPALPAVAEVVEEDEEEAAAPLVEAEALPEQIPQLAPRRPLTAEGLQRIVAVAQKTGDRAAVFWTRPDDAEAVTASADPARFPFPVLILTAGQARSLETLLEGVSPGRLSTTADADFVQRMLGRDQDRVTQRIAIDAPRGTLLLTLHRTGPPPLWSDPRDGGVPARVSGPEGTAWVGALQLPISRLSVAFEAAAPLEEEAARRLASERLDALVLAHLWRLVDALPDGPATHRLLAELTAQLGLPHFVETDGQVHLELSFPASGPRAAEALWGRPLCLDHLGRPVPLARLMEVQGSAEVLHLGDPEDLPRLEAIERKLGWGHLATPALSATRLERAVWDGQAWRTGRKAADGTGATAIVWLGACLHTPLPEGEGWQAAPEAPELPGIGAAVKEHLHGSVDWEAGLACLHQVLLEQREKGWTAPSFASERAQARGSHALLQLAGHRGPAALRELRWLRSRDGRALPLSSVLQSPRRAAHPLHGAQVHEAHTFALSLDALRVIWRVLGPDALPLRFDDPPSVWWTLQEPEEAPWLLRRRVEVPGLRGWIGLRRAFDDTTGTFVRDRGSWIALTEREPGPPCHGLLWGEGAAHLDVATRELLAMTRVELYTELMERLQAGAWGGEDKATAEAYAARYAAHRARPREEERSRSAGESGPLRVAGDDRLDPLQARLEPIFGREAGGHAFGLKLVKDGDSEPMVRLSHAEGEGLFSFMVSRDSPLWLRAVADRGNAREELSELCQQALEERLPAVRSVVGHRPRLEAMAFYLVGGGSDRPQLTVGRDLGPLAFHLMLNADQPVVAAAVREPGPARELVLLECARVIHEHLAEVGELTPVLGSGGRGGRSLDLHTTHRRLVAARLA